MTTQSSPVAKKLSGWLGRQFSNCCGGRVQGVRGALPRGTLWFLGTQRTGHPPGCRVRGQHSQWAPRFRSRPRPAVSQHGRGASVKSEQPEPRAHQGVPVRPAEVPFDGPIVQADPLVVLSIACGEPASESGGAKVGAPRTCTCFSALHPCGVDVDCWWVQTVCREWPSSPGVSSSNSDS